MPTDGERVWNPIEETHSREFCVVSEAVRVVRERVFFGTLNYYYEVQTPTEESWLIVLGMIPTEDGAFAEAERYASFLKEEVTTR